MEQAAPRSPQFLKTPDAAARLGLSPRTLEKHRCYGTGPNFHKLGGRVVYSIDALDAWAELGRRRSTHDPGTAVRLPAKRFDVQPDRCGRAAPPSRTEERRGGAEGGRA